MANPEHVKVLLQGVAVWNNWLVDQKKKYSCYEVDLSGFDIWSQEAQESALFMALRDTLVKNEEHPPRSPFWCLVPDLRGIFLTYMILRKAHLAGAYLLGAEMNGADLSQAHLDEANLSMARLENANLSRAYLKGANLSRAHLMGANLTEAHLEGARLSFTHLEEANLAMAHLEGADFGGAHLEEAKLWEAHLDEASLAWAHLEGADLSGTDMEGAVLSDAHLEGADLNGTDMEGADLSDAHLERADLIGAHLEGAFLREAHLEGAFLEGADLRNTDVTGVNFDRWGKYQGIRLEGCYGSQRFVRHAKDQDFLEELRGWDGDMRPWKWNWRFWKKTWWSRKKFEGMTWRFWLIYLPWLILCDCGRSMLLWAGWSILMACGFAWRFATLGEGAFKFTEQLGWGFQTALYYSVVTFTTLGFGDVTPLTHQAARWVMGEVIAGYIMLGGLISIFANKLARRGG